MKEAIHPDKKFKLYMFLASFFLANALIAEVVGSKIFSVEKLFGISSSFFSLNMSVGILMWPIVFIISDIVNEYFGKEGVRRLSIMGAALIGYAFLIIFSSTKLPAADFWLSVNGVDPQGNSFNIDYAYNTIFSQGMGIIIGSITAFLVGQFVDMYVFHYLRKLTEHKMLWLRATGSTVVSQIIDSFLILFIAFYLLGNWSIGQVFAVGIIQYIYKVSIAILLTPVIYWMHFFIDRYLGKKQSDLMFENAKDI